MGKSMSTPLKVIFLGTSGAIPTTRRALPAILVLRGGELNLFDCGEGTQRQMVFAKIGFCGKMKIFITHMHGDHILGLPGLLQTMALNGRTRLLEVYGPSGIYDFIDSIIRTVQFGMTYPIKIREFGSGIICREKEYEIRAVWSKHSISTLAYSLTEYQRPGRFYPEKARSLGLPEGPLWSKLQHGCQVKNPEGEIVTSDQVMGPPRPGRKIVYSGDTGTSKALLDLSKNADLLIHEATLDDDLADEAFEIGHSTPSQAAKIARYANVKLLVLTHISARYNDRPLSLEKARTIFPNIRLAEDFMELQIPYSD
jgi:ribonuclease Z